MAGDSGALPGSGRAVEVTASVKNNVKDVAKYSSETAKSSAETLKNYEQLAKLGVLGGGGGAIGPGYSSSAGKEVALTTPNPIALTNGGGQVMPYTFGGGGGGGGGFSNPPSAYISEMPPQQPDMGVRGSSGILKKLGTFGMLASTVLPTIDEALKTDLLGNRYRFYGGAGTFGYNEFEKNRGQRAGGSYNVMRDMALYGTPTDKMDPIFASNLGAATGLVPGLRNYGVGQNFGGIMGGAALASNLVPGVGLQSGVAAMATLNKARSVNMLRMIGVNVRSNDATTMRDFPAIINQLYSMLKQSAGTEPTPEMISVSAMSGNALDSILSQYFGQDETLRQSVLAGLVQLTRAKSIGVKADIGLLGSKANLVKTRATSAAEANLANRFAKETGITQAAAQPVLTGAMIGNDMISLILNSVNRLISVRGKGSGIFDSVSGLAAKGLIASKSTVDQILGGLGNGRFKDLLYNYMFGSNANPLDPSARAAGLARSLGVAGAATSLLTGGQMLATNSNYEMPIGSGTLFGGVGQGAPGYNALAQPEMGPGVSQVNSLNYGYGPGTQNPNGINININVAPGADTSEISGAVYTAVLRAQSAMGGRN